MSIRNGQEQTPGKSEQETMARSYLNLQCLGLELGLRHCGLTLNASSLCPTLSLCLGLSSRLNRCRFRLQQQQLSTVGLSLSLVQNLLTLQRSLGRLLASFSFVTGRGFLQA